jgi:ubiquinone/menaquinone biosynthesis C-methylase UbiE
VRNDYYADYYEFEDKNWWFVSRRRILLSLLKKYLPPSKSDRKILDAGCGTGINLSMLSQFGKVLGIDSSEEAIHFCNQRGEEKVQLAKVENLPFDKNEFDFITALDVLEHIQDDDKAIRELARVCKPQGMVLITVPVHPSLWGEHDEVNQHIRRV